tara:strand:+ start:221 stop:514 length:294 start_codon:yes stop_codon:yes gene_type:complete
MQRSFVYIIKCKDDSYYVGMTSNLEQRWLDHQKGTFENSYTGKRRPLQLVYFAEFTTIVQAITMEKQIKKWSRAKKEALIRGDLEDLVQLAKKKFNK